MICRIFFFIWNLFLFESSSGWNWDDSATADDWNGEINEDGGGREMSLFCDDCCDDDGVDMIEALVGYTFKSYCRT